MNETQRQLMPLDAALFLLDRHGLRRRQRVPTLSVIVGAGNKPVRLARHWIRLARLVVCETSNVRLPELVSDWFVRLAAARNLPAAAYAWLAVRTDQSGGELWRRLRDRASDERGLFLDRTLGAAAASPVEIVCRAIVEHDCEQGSTAAGLWDRLLSACRDDIGALFVGVAAVVGRDGLPGLFVNLSAGATLLDVDAASQSLTALTSLLPRLNALLAISPKQLEGFLAQTSESHCLAFVREGLIRLDGPTAPSEAAPGSGELASAAAEPSPALEQETWTPEPADNDPARSRAERFLFDRLQSHPETANLFEINGIFTAGDGWRGSMEVDLLARGVRVAVEIDGYFHFQDLEAYRRDRRKDVLLQRAGYLVVRCLADDVVSRLEEIMHTIVAAVRLRRAWRLRAEELS
ncbi:MAG TPA: DUF559 domain-containing protein [Pirellulales bacterium]|nr:DUF559 domain-containing protein [Pirellulales bacterium]